LDVGFDHLNPNVIYELRNHIYMIKGLQNYVYFENGIDRG